MPIEFRCANCQRLLRTADNTAGRQTKCPQCGTILVIPGGPAEPQADSPGGDQTAPRASLPDAPNAVQSSAAMASGAAPGEPAIGSPFASSAGASPFAGQSAGSEFGGPTGSANPYASPSATPQSPYGAMPGQLGFRGLDIGQVTQSAWTIYTTRFAECLLSSLIMFGLNLAGALVFGGLIALGIGLTLALFQDAEEAAAAGVVIVSIVLSIPLLLYLSWLFAGHSIFMLKLARGEATSYGDLFRGAPYIGRFLLAWLLVGLAVGVGCMLCIVPGVLLWMICIQYQWLIVDRNLGVSDALSQSNQLSIGNKGALFVLLILVMGIWMVVGMVGYVIPLIPQLFAMPFVMLLMVVSYLHASGQRSADMLWPPRA